MKELHSDIAEKTTDRLGDDEAGLFVNAYTDFMIVQFEIDGAYSEAEKVNIVFQTFLGMLKELSWLQLYFYAGNYPVLKGRLRYLWEAIFRGYFLETDPATKNLGVDDRVMQIDKMNLNWNSCMSKVLSQISPAADVPKAIAEAHIIWKELNQYVHPSGYLQMRLIDPSALLVHDAFDEQWARSVLVIAPKILDLVVLAVIRFHSRILPEIDTTKFALKYPNVELLAKP
jgi:hypothetical protein